MESRQRLLEQLLERTNEGFWFIDVNGVTLDVNPAMCAILARDRREVIGKTIFDFVDAENEQIFRREIAARRAGTESTTYELGLQRPSGEVVPCINNASSVWDENGDRAGSIGLWKDVSKLKDVERELLEARANLAEQVEQRTLELKRSEQRLREAHRVARLGSWDLDAEGNLEWSDEVFELFAFNPNEFDGTPASFYRVVHPEDRERVQAQMAHARKHLDRYQCDHRIKHPCGEVRVVRESASVVRDGDGGVQHLSGTVQDITEQVEADQALRQMQKMEAIGQLTGGIAHDFNNLLAVISGAAEFLEMSRVYDHELVESISRAAERGAELTHRMLAYAKQQPLHTSRINFAELVNGMMGLLQRTLGADIDVVLRLDEDLWSASADPGQVEDAILNLALNARDAMPNGGKLTIQCSNEHRQSSEPHPAGAVQGSYVVLKFIDTGHGMSAHALEHATEPFYTTKGANRSGLGLSMIHGFAQQSGGHLSIQSEEGVGTVVELALPRCLNPDETAPVTSDTSVPLGDGEQVLVIEDEPAVGRLVERLLKSLNYIPHVVHDAAQARYALDTGTIYDLILSDVMLPNQISGPEFIEEVKNSTPKIKVLFMSGYSSAERGEQFAKCNPLIQKPFRRGTFARALRQVMQ